MDETRYQPRTLQAELTARGRLPAEECLRLALTLTSALAYLHQNKLNDYVKFYTPTETQQLKLYPDHIVRLEFDEFSGVLRIKVQAYNPEMAQAITRQLVLEGERYMNVLGHEMAQVQVDFLVTQVDQAQERFQRASQDLLNYQNEAGLLSPQATAESINAIVAALEGQRAQLQTQLASLPKSLDRDHPNILMLKQSLGAVDAQIKQEKLKLATPSGGTLNAYVEEFYRLDMNVKFTQELYKSSLTALEKGRIDATRMLEKVSVLQSATLPEYPMEPRRLYNTLVTLLVALMLAGILKLLKSIVLDHVD